MIPAAVIAMLATVRLGAIHAVVFGGFSSPALAQRIDACHPRVIMTASCGIEGTRAPIAYKPLVHEAIKKASFKPPKTLIWQRDQMRWDPVVKEHGERNWARLVKSARNRGMKAGAVPVNGDDPVYIIYTSGTTGTPKGVLRPAAGHAVGLVLSMKHIFGVRGPGDVVFTASDIGWVVGHSYIGELALPSSSSAFFFWFLYFFWDACVHLANTNSRECQSGRRCLLEQLQSSLKENL